MAEQKKKRREFKWAAECPHCKGRSTYYRSKTADMVCKRCGWAWKVE